MVENISTACGIDFGNGRIDICIFDKVASMPAGFGLKKPQAQIDDRGIETKLKAFKLIIKDREVWFDLDILGGPITRELDDLKYDPSYMSIIFSGILYKWSRQYGVELSSLGKLNVVASMPPGLFSDRAKNKQAQNAYQATFNRRQSHLKIRDGKTTSQVVTRFGGLQREAVGTINFASQVEKIILLIDIGYGTVDYALYNNSKLIFSKSENAGLLHAFEQINPVNPNVAELDYLRNKKVLPEEVLVHFGLIKNRIAIIRRGLQSSRQREIDKLIIIGGGGPMMTPELKRNFGKLARSIVVKGADVNVRNNWKVASNNAN